MPKLKSRDRFVVILRPDWVVLERGAIEIWTNEELCALRDLTVGLHEQGFRRLAVDLRHVLYLPGGVFGLLLGCVDQGTEIRLLAPRPRVRNMLWFRMFAQRVGTDGIYRLCAQPVDGFEQVTGI